MSLKGKRKLYTDIVPISLPDQAKGTAQTSASNSTARHNIIASRYYYHAVLCRKRYDDCLKHLHQEFNLEPETLVGYIDRRAAYVARMVDSNITAADLKKDFPWFNWSLN